MWELRIVATYRQIEGAIAVGYDCVDCEWREKVSAFSLFCLAIIVTFDVKWKGNVESS